jgi:lipooligosaccharide transport system permease protein
MTGRPGALLDALPLLQVTAREARVWRRGWRVAGLSRVVVPVVFVGAIGLGLGRLVDANHPSVGGVGYLVFVTPGILAATTLDSAALDSLWPVMSGLRRSRWFHAVAATPLSPGQIYGGYVTWVGLRLAMNAVPFVAVAALMGAVTSPWAVLAAPAAVLGGLAFAAPLCAFSAAQESDASFSFVMRVVVMPMFLFSGTFFPVDQLPGWLGTIARITPLWHAVELCRGATTGSLGAAAALGHVLFLGACVAAGCWGGVRTFRARLAA